MCKTLYFPRGSTAITKEVLNEMMKGYKEPDDFYGPDGIIK